MAEENEVIAPAPELPEQIAAALSPETFDVASWLAQTSYAEDSVEIYNGGPATYELLELQTQLDNAQKRKDERSLLGAEVQSIADATHEDTVLNEARARVGVLREELKGSGATFHVRGVAPVERDLISKKIAKTFKPAKAQFEEIDGEKLEIEPAKEGGLNHPDYNVAFENALIARSITRVVFPNGKEDLSTRTADTIQQLREQLPITEFRRLAGAVFDVNYFSYQIDQLTTVDF